MYEWNRYHYISVLKQYKRTTFSGRSILSLMYHIAELDDILFLTHIKGESIQKKLILWGAIFSDTINQQWSMFHQISKYCTINSIIACHWLGTLFSWPAILQNCIMPVFYITSVCFLPLEDHCFLPWLVSP